MSGIRVPVLEDSRRVAEAFVALLGRRHFSRMRDLFNRQTRFRALVPPGLREAQDGAGAADYFRRWFGDAEHFEIVRSAIDVLGSRVHISYRIRLREDDIPYVVEQQAYLNAENGRISAVDLLCSGFLPELDGAGIQDCDSLGRLLRPRRQAYFRPS